MKPKTILISGADGYVAHHLAERLKLNNYKVVTSTRNNRGHIWLDFSKPDTVASTKSANIDFMIHTVSPNEGLYKTEPYAALEEVVSGIHSALDFCVNNNIMNFIYISSFHVFGNHEGILTEDTSVAPYNDYGLGHCIAEQTVQMFDRTHKLNAWIIRPSNLFGIPINIDKFKRWNLIPFSFCKEAVESNSITLLTPGNQLRNFVGVSDVCKKVIWILEQRPSGRIVHAYGNETMSVMQYALLVQKIAYKTFHLPVRILRPDGNDNVIGFDFTSLYKNSSFAPIDRLESFVVEMLRLLLNRI